MPPFLRVPRPVHWAVGLPSTCPLLLPPAWRAERSLSLLFSLLGPSHCYSHKLWQLQLATTGARPARPEWAQRSASIRIMLGGLSLLPDLERYYKSSVPDSIAAAIWFTGTTKKSHAYVTLIDGLIILDHEDPSRASGFHSNHHIDDKYPRVHDIYIQLCPGDAEMEEISRLFKKLSSNYYVRSSNYLGCHVIDVSTTIHDLPSKYSSWVNATFH